MKRKIGIIPSYEPPRSFIEYVNTLLEKGVDEVIVVNDGSNEKYNEIYQELSNITNCKVLSYNENHGKGYALKTAFTYCKENYGENDVFITADCDGQHLPNDVIKVANAAYEHPGKLVLGARDFSDPSVPARSRSGNIQTRRAFKFLYRISLSDTQTGLRAFSYQLLDRLISISGNRFEYEMNMLILLHKAGIGIIEVPIETVYNEKSEDVERVSHFRTISDSLRVFSTLFKNLGWYMLSSVISAVTDVAAFYFLLSFLFTQQPQDLANLLATVSARVISSIINFIFNFKFVFNGKSKSSIVKYYCLWAVQLGASYGILTLWTVLFENLTVTEPAFTLLLTLCKGLSDLILAMFSYQIQSRWVFVTHEHNRLHFWGPFFRFSRRIVNMFKPKYRSFVYPDEKKPCIYVSRHLNLHGPFKIAQSFEFSVHMFVLNYFVNFKKCYKQYSTYTFTARHGKKIGLWAKIKSFFAALYVVPLVRSTRPVCVYRGGSDSLATFRQSMAYLEKGENLMVFPDIDYTADENKASDIYSGFLFLDKLYFKKFGEHITFVAISVNDTKRTIEELGRVSFVGDESFEDEMPKVAEKLKELLMNK